MASSKHEHSAQNDKNGALMKAVRANKYKRVKQLLIEGADPNYTPDYTVDGKKIPPLHSAVRNRHTDIVRILLKNNADPNVEDEEGATPLFAALFSNTPSEIPKLLIKSGADTNHENKSGIIPLIKMIENYMYWGNEFDKQTLLDLLYSCDNLYQKTTNGMSMVHLLLAVHSSERSVLSTPDHVCLVYLHYLMKKGITLDTIDPLGRTAIHYAASASCYQSIKLLIKNGVNAKIKDINGQTPFHHLRFHSNEQMNPFKNELSKLIDILIKHGCDINEQDFFGRTVIHYTANNDSTTKMSSLKLLCNRGAILTIKDKANMTALHLAVLPTLGTSEEEDDCGNLSNPDTIDAIKFLVENGVGVNETDSSQLTALHLAVREQSTDVIQALIQLGADVNKTTKTGESALHRATLNIKNFKCVLKHCIFGTIYIDKQDNFGSTPLHWASSHSENEFEVTDILKNYGAVINIKDNNDKLASELNFTHVPEDHVLEYGGQYKSQKRKLSCYESHIAYTKPFENYRILKVCPFVDRKKVDKEQDHERYRDMKQPEKEKSEQGMTVSFKRSAMWEHLSTNKQVSEKNKEDSLKFVKNVFHNPPSNMALVNNIDENESVAAAVHALVLYISEKINSDFQLFTNSVSLTGSWNEGTKALYPNEFDYNWHLSNFNEAFTIKKNTTLSGGYVRLHLKESTIASDFVSYVNEEGDLDGRKVICDFYQIINNILLLADIACPGSIYVKKYLTIDKGSIDKLVLEWVGPVYKCMLVNIDIVPSIEAKQFSSNNMQLDKNIMRRICRDEPLEIVLKTPNERVVRDANFYFRISVAKQESLIIKSLPTPVKKGFSLLKGLREFIYPPRLTNKQEIMLTSYKLKTCFLHVLEEAAKNSGEIMCNIETINNDEKEKEEKIEKNRLLEFKASQRLTIDWAYRIVDFLSRSIEDALLPSFFLPSVNLHVNESQSVCNEIHICMKECERLQELLAVGMEDL